MCPTRSAFESEAFTNTTTIAGFAVKSSASYYAGGANDATDGESLGADIGAINTAMLITDSGNNTGGGGGAVTITTASPLPNALVGTAYTGGTLACSGGTGPYTWALANSTTLPTSMTLGSSTGIIAGTPTVAVIKTFDIRCTDSLAATVVKTFQLTVNSNRVRQQRYNWSFAATFAQSAPPVAADLVRDGDFWTDTDTDTVNVATVTGTCPTSCTIAWNPIVSGGGSSGEANTTSNQGGGVGLAMTKTGVNLPFKTLVAGTNITLTPAADTVTIAASGGGGGAAAITVTLQAYQWTSTGITSGGDEHPIGGYTGGRTRGAANLTGMGSCRMHFNQTSANGTAGLTVKVQYSTDGSAWSDTGMTHVIGTTGSGTNFWPAYQTLAAGAKTDVLLRIYVLGGNGTTSELNNTFFHVVCKP
jgi:hypothetical protein